MAETIIELLRENYDDKHGVVNVRAAALEATLLNNLKRMAGTTRLELATSAVTESQTLNRFKSSAWNSSLRSLSL